MRSLTAQGIIAGKPLGADYEELQDCLLVCATELRTEAEMDDYASASGKNCQLAPTGPLHRDVIKS